MWSVYDSRTGRVLAVLPTADEAEKVFCDAIAKLNEIADDPVQLPSVREWMRRTAESIVYGQPILYTERHVERLSDQIEELKRQLAAQDAKPESLASLERYLS